MQPIEAIPMDPLGYLSHGNQYESDSSSQMFMDSYMLEIMNYQNYLNMELLKNQNLIASYISCNKNTEKNVNSVHTASSTSQAMENSFHALPSYQGVIELGKPKKEVSNCNLFRAEQLRAHQIKNSKKVKRCSEDSQYEPDRSDTSNYKSAKSSQSKNVPKNFSKALLLFIKRKQNVIKKIVEQEGVDYLQFVTLCKSLRGKINSIAQLRSLWVDSQNQYARVFRIISCFYIRKSSLHHIFNSRVEDFSKHLKYRNKIFHVLKNPYEFTTMKDY